MISPQLENVTLAMVAGGAGRRIGAPKAWLQFGDESILAWHIKRLQWPGPTLLVTSPSTANPPDAELFDREVADPVDGAGPLRGVLTALEHATTSFVVVTAVDMPAVGRSALHWLARTLADHGDCLGLMCRAKSDAANLDAGNLQGGDLIEPFPSAFRTSAGPAIADRLQKGHRSMHRLCEDPAFLAIDPPADWPAGLWTNLNEPGQLEAYTARLNLRRSGTPDENSNPRQ